MDLEGKKVLFLGDSITEGVGTPSKDMRCVSAPVGYRRKQ